jgi:hypothetical protein
LSGGGGGEGFLDLHGLQGRGRDYIF